MILASFYLRVFTWDQDANRTRAALPAFAASRKDVVAGIYTYSFVRTKLRLSGLQKLLTSMHPRHVLCLESVYRLPRLSKRIGTSLRDDPCRKFESDICRLAYELGPFLRSSQLSQLHLQAL